MKSKTYGCIILFILSFILYGNSISNNYALDDFIVIKGNKFTQEGINGLKDIFTHDAFIGVFGSQLNFSGGRYRPLSVASFAIEKDLFGYKPGVFHFFNVLFFALTVVLIFLLLERLLTHSQSKIASQKYNLPFLAALLFLILPVHTEVIANIKSRDEIYSLFFSLLTLLILIPKQKFIKTKPVKSTDGKGQNKSSNSFLKILLSAIIFLLALLSKENAITFLAVIPIALYLFTTETLSKILLKTLPLLVVSVIYIIMRAKFAGIVGDRVSTNIMDDPYVHATFVQKFFTIAYVQLKYIGLLIFPVTLSYDYSFNQIKLVDAGNILSIISILAHLTLIVIAIISFRKNKIVSFSILYYFITFSIVSNLFFNIGTSMAERFLYMPSLGVCLIIAFGLIHFLKIENTFKVIPSIVILLIVFLAATKIIARNKDWSNNYTLFKTDVEKVPQSASAQLYYGVENYKKFEKTNNLAFADTAIVRMKISTEINPKYLGAWLNLAYTYEHSNRPREALECYNRSLELDSTNAQAIYEIAYLYGTELNLCDTAIPYFSKLINEIKPLKREYFEGIANCYAALGKMQEAIGYYKSGISEFPNASKLYYNCGVAYAHLMKSDSSRLYMNKAFALDPSLMPR